MNGVSIADSMQVLPVRGFRITKWKINIKYLTPLHSHACEQYYNDNYNLLDCMLGQEVDEPTHDAF